MKKIISLILMIAMLISVSAFAEEEFSLHNGIKFGMTKDEVLRTEIEAGFGLVDGRYGEGKIAGYDGAVRCEYRGRGVTLDKVCYFYYSPSTQSYTALGNALTNKYGAPTHTSNSGTYYAVNDEMEIGGSIGIAAQYTDLPITCQSLDEKAVFSETFNRMFVFECIGYEQWLVPQEDGSAVLIDHSMLVQHNSILWNAQKQKADGWDKNTYELIIYTQFSADEAATLQENTGNIYDGL